MLGTLATSQTFLKEHWFFGVNFHIVAIEKKPVQIVERFLLGINEKSHHILSQKCHLSPYLDNEFLLVARTSQDSK